MMEKGCGSRYRKQRVPRGIIADVRLLLLLLLLYGARASGEDLRIRGEVTDSEGAVIGHATIRLLGEQPLQRGRVWTF